MNSDNPRPKVTIDDIYAAADRLKSAQLDGQDGPERQALRDRIDAFLAPYEPPSWLIGVLRTVPQIIAQFEAVDSGTHDCWVDDEQALELWTPLPAPPAVPERLLSRAEEQIELLLLDADQYEDMESFDLAADAVRTVGVIRDLMNALKREGGAE